MSMNKADPEKEYATEKPNAQNETNEEIVAKIKTGKDTAASLQQLWLQTKAYIYKIAIKYSGYAEIDDLMQEGYIGLQLAAEHYETNQDKTFIGYLTFWVKQRMRRYIENNASIRLPSWMYQYVMRYKKFVREYVQEYAHEPSETEQRDFLDVSKEELDEIKKAAKKADIKSLNAKISKDDESITIADVIASNNNIEEEIIKKRDWELMSISLRKAVDELPEEKKNIICKIYYDGKTRTEIGEEIGKTRTAVTNLEHLAIRRLRNKKNQNYKVYYEEYLKAYAFRHVGRTEFNRTWYSEVELAVLGK